MARFATAACLTLLACFAMGAPSPAHADETVILRSGQAAIGSNDPLVTRLDCPGCSDTYFPNPFTPGDFAAAASGPHAIVIARNSLWIPQLSDPAAKWINNTGNQATGGTALYAVPFHISLHFSAATLKLKWAVDNALGEQPGLSPPCTSVNQRAGIYVNGSPVPGTAGVGGFDQEYAAQNLDIGSFMVVGDNVLYFYDYDCGSAGGIMFSATIQTYVVTPSLPPSWGTLKLHYR